MAEPKTIFLTGYTGALGKEFARELLQEDRACLILLVRSNRRLKAVERVRKILEGFGEAELLGTRIEVMEGDVTFPRLGLSAKNVARLKKETDEIYHIAALTTLNGSQEDCEKINVGGTEEVLKLAEDFHQGGRLKRFFYFSTAFVAGSLQSYVSKEDELPEKPVFANYYESSKNKAETQVRAAMKRGLPVTIFRPSIVVGHSETGEVSEFNVIYPFFKMFAHGILSVLPTRPENSFNIVPIDFIVRAAARIARQKESIGKTYHLVSKNPPTIKTLLRLKEEEYPNMPPIQVVPPEKFRRESLDQTGQFVYDTLSPYLGYLNEHLSFDTTNADRALEGTGIDFPKTDYDFLKTLCQYAVQAGYILAE